MVSGSIVRRALVRLVVVAGAALVAACGGGGGGSATTATTVAASWPSGGTFVPVLKAFGSSTASPLNIALSLVHPATPTVEYVMDASAAPAALGLTLEQGTFDAAAQQFSARIPVAYVDSAGGVLRTTALQALGARPVQTIGSSVSLCSTSMQANNFANPYLSQIVAATPGADGVCGNADDKQATITFNAAGQPSFTASPATVLGFLRSPVTGQPSFWFNAFADGSMNTTNIASTFNGSVTANILSFSTPGTTYTFKPVQNLNDTILFTQSGVLKGLSATGTIPALATLSVQTGPDGWQAAGADSSKSYVYLNSSSASSGAGTWRLLSVSRSNLTTSTVATGAGSIYTASVVPGTIYATIFNGSTDTVYKISTATGALSTYIAASSSVVSALSSGANNSNLVIVASGSNVSTLVVDDAGVQNYAVSSGTLYGADQNVIDIVTGNYIAASHIFLSPIGTLGFSASAITRYDIATKTVRTIGVVPSGSALGGLATDPVFIGAVLPDRGFGGSMAARLISGQLQSSGAAVYTYSTGTANSLTKTTSQVR